MHWEKQIPLQGCLRRCILTNGELLRVEPHFPVMKPCQPPNTLPGISPEPGDNQSPCWRPDLESSLESVDVVQQTDAASFLNKKKRFEIPFVPWRWRFVFLSGSIALKAAISHAGGGADLNLEVEGAPPFFWVSQKFQGWFFVAKKRLVDPLEIFEIVWTFQFRPFSFGNVSHFFGGSMDWNWNRDCWHGSWWHVVEFQSQMSIFRVGHHYFNLCDQAVHIRSSLGQVGHAEGWMESCKARVSKVWVEHLLEISIFGTIYDIGGWVITFGSITLALLWYDINSPTCWCSPKHGGVFFPFCAQVSPRCRS